MKWTKSYLTCIKRYEIVKSYIRLFCQEMGADDLYPYDTLEYMLQDMDLYPEDIWELAQNNPDVDRNDRVFCGDEEVVYSFEDWEEYIYYFMKHVDGEEFLEFCKEEES